MQTISEERKKIKVFSPFLAATVTPPPLPPSSVADESMKLAYRSKLYKEVCNASQLQLPSAVLRDSGRLL